MVKKKPHKERSDADRRVRQCERLARLMQVLHLISGRGRWDASALAEELECSTRTIHRLLQTLSMAGVPWFFDEKTRSYSIRPGYKFPMVEEKSSSVQSKSEFTSEMKDAANQLVQDGEAFSKSLENFLSLIQSLSRQ
ncbi:HTH domain protein [Rubinisphaera italica]|uniref:HTH domain protein n=2 Tax=Rubinisphaera italica TaxID=2527969 RepID=A0A5C5XDF3_9PLAN|nr:HTH domain protein [Rubinisphaera italica]